MIIKLTKNKYYKGYKIIKEYKIRVALSKTLFSYKVVS